MVVDRSVGWGAVRCVGDGVGSSDGNTFGIDDVSDMNSSNGLFDG